MNTGHPVVDQMARIHLQGNVIPTQWFKHITFANGKPNATAVIILSEICYWYKPTIVRDEQSGEIVSIKKKFAADKLHKDYQKLADQFGFTKRQVVDAITLLRKLGLITLEIRAVKTPVGTVPKAPFLEPVVSEIIRITFDEENSQGIDNTNQRGLTPVITGEQITYNGSSQALQRDNTSITTITTTSNKKNPPKRKKPVYEDDSPYMKMAVYLKNKIKSWYADLKEPNLQTWADHFRKIVELDKRSKEDIKTMIDWVTANTFWQGVILSADSLRDNWDKVKVQMVRPSVTVYKDPKQNAKRAKVPESVIKAQQEIEQGHNQTTVTMSEEEWAEKNRRYDELLKELGEAD